MSIYGFKRLAWLENSILANVVHDSIVYIACMAIYSVLCCILRACMVCMVLYGGLHSIRCALLYMVCLALYGLHGSIWLAWFYDV